MVFSNNYDKLSSGNVELNPGPSDMNTVLSAIQASENKVLNEIRSCCQILHCIFGLQRQFNLLCQFCKLKNLRANIPRTKVVVFKKGPVLASNEQWTFVWWSKITS